MLLGDWLTDAVARLERAEVPEPRTDAQMLAAHALDKSRSWVLAHPEAVVPDAAEELVQRREKREPLAYILGWREFYGRRFTVEPGVLIPRQETETLVDVALEGLGGKVLDIGTGSGCLAVTIKLERPNWMVAACDVSAIALRLARKNAETLGALVHVAKSDLFQAFGDIKFGIVVSNPPYISLGTALQPEVAQFEPEEALYAGKDGMVFYRRLANEGKRHLMPWGRLIVELGNDMSEMVQETFESEGWTHLETRADLGGMPRAAVFQPKS